MAVDEEYEPDAEPADVGDDADDNDGGDEQGDDGGGAARMGGDMDGEYRQQEGDAEEQEEQQGSLKRTALDGQAQQPPAKKRAKDKVKITYEKYQTISRAITMHLRKQEAGVSEQVGMSRQDIVDWYLSVQTEIANPEDLLIEAKVIRSVLKNMLKKDQSLVTAHDVGEDGEPKYTVHPNIVIEQ